jgi:hypothetical protein
MPSAEQGAYAPITNPRVVADLMSWPALEIDSARDVGAATTTMVQHHVRHLVVVCGRVPLGVVCKQELRNLPATTPVAQTIRSATLVSSTDDLERVVDLLRMACSCVVPVFVSGHWFGILTRGDLARASVGGPWLRCSACDSHHRVVATDPGQPPFCARCMDDLRPREFDDLYVDTGVGD